GPVVPGQGEQVEVADAIAVHDGRFVQDAQQVGRVGGGLRLSVVDDPPEETAEGTFVPPCEKLFRVGCFDVEADDSPVHSPSPFSMRLSPQCPAAGTCLPTRGAVRSSGPQGAERGGDQAVRGYKYGSIPPHFWALGWR